MTTTAKYGGRVVVRILHVGEKTKVFSAQLPEGRFLVIYYLDRNQRKFETEIYNELHFDFLKSCSAEYQAAEQAVADYVRYRDDFI